MPLVIFPLPSAWKFPAELTAPEPSNPLKRKAYVPFRRLSKDATSATLAEPIPTGSTLDVAITFTAAGPGKLLGAVYSPLLSTVPQAEPLQPVPVTLQITLV